MGKMVEKVRGAFRSIRHARYVALVVIAFAIVMYASPHLLDAVQCIVAIETHRDRCLEKTYNRARRDTNLAAIIIALAVTLTAWRPERQCRRPNRRRPTQSRTRNRHNSPRRPQLRRSEDGAP